jgi:tryptophan-rich sensory protein
VCSRTLDVDHPLLFLQTAHDLDKHILAGLIEVAEALHPLARPTRHAAQAIVEQVRHVAVGDAPGGERLDQAVAADGRYATIRRYLNRGHSLGERIRPLTVFGGEVVEQFQIGYCPVYARVSIRPRTVRRLCRAKVQHPLNKQGESPAMSTTALSLSAASRSRSATQPRFALLGGGTVLASVAANALFYFLGSTVVAYDPEFRPLANVSGAIIMTVVPAIVAVLLYAALRRFIRQPARIFTIISAIVFVVTLVPDFTYIPTVAGVTDAQIAILVTMHVVAALVIVRMLTSSDRSSAR